MSAGSAEAAAAALLVVDDNEDNRYTLTRRLMREGYTNVTTATNGREALDLLHRRHFDLMLLDIMMPDLDGYQVLERLQGDAALRDMPVIMISALEEVDSVIRCVELGAEDYLAKPFNPTLLRARVGASLEKKRLRDEVKANLDRVERELQAARALQLGMLPSTFPEASAAQPVKAYALMDPAREVGGDLYDAFYAPDGMFCFLVGDVSGKGAAAAMFMARTRSLARMAVSELRPRLTNEESLPAYIAEVVNRELCQNNRERMFVTLFLGFLDGQGGALTYVNAGHPLPYLLRASGELERIDGKPETPLAVRPSMRYRNRTAMLQPGDTLFVFTDGVVEAMNAAGEHYSSERLEAQLRAAVDAAPEPMANAVKISVDAFTGDAPKADDVAILALRRRAAQD
jgi:sigma-B regulation protein RsbU (phosphoserine phosphatase)